MGVYLRICISVLMRVCVGCVGVLLGGGGVVCVHMCLQILVRVHYIEQIYFA